jgi:phage terminase large subunit
LAYRGKELVKVAVKSLEVNLPYKPLPKQQQFHGAAAKYRFFGGGFGNGKTAAGCFEAFMLSMEYPGTEGVICRKTRPELKATTQAVFFKGGGGNPATDWPGCPQELIRSFNKTEGRLELINGSVIHFWPLDDPDKLTNLNLGWFLVDQAEEVPEEMFLMLRGRLRRRKSPRKGIILFNPNGHDWIWKWCKRGGGKNNCQLIHAKTSDNPTLTADYLEQFNDYPRKWRERFFDGSFDVFTDQIWPEFDPDIHVIRPFDIPPWFEIVEGIDHGRRNPTAVVWAAFDEVGNCFVIDEHYQAGQLVGHHAQKILQKREHRWGEPNYTVIDASAAAEDPNTGRSVIDEYWDYGIPTIPSDRHKIARVNRVAEWLRLKPDWPHPRSGRVAEPPEDYDPAVDDYGYPRLYIFQNCVNLIEHVPQYKWKPKPPTQEEDAKEEPLKKDDHDVDALGYILMSRPAPASKPNVLPHMDARTRNYWDMVNKKTSKRKSGSRHSRLGVEA